MSGSYVDGVIVPERLVRDFLYTNVAGTLGEVHDIPLEFNTVGLDFFIRNRGAAALTVSFNGSGNVITVDPGDVYIVNDFKFWFVEVISTVIYDLQIYGIRITTLRQKGLI